MFLSLSIDPNIRIKNIEIRKIIIISNQIYDLNIPDLKIIFLIDDIFDRLTLVSIELNL